MLKFEQYQSIAEELIAKDQERDALFEKSDQLYKIESVMPAEWQQLGWVRWLPSTKIADSIDTAVRALSTKTPTVSITPTRGNPETRAQYNRIEKGLKWILAQASRRSQSNPVRDMASSAIRYDEVAAQIVYLPQMEKSYEALTGKRKRRAARYGDFAVIVHHPACVHSVVSDYMPEKVLLVRTQMVGDVIAFWGEAAKELRDDVTKDNPECAITDYCTVYDYIDEDARVVWASVTTNNTRPQSNAVYVTATSPQTAAYRLVMEKNETGFIPWVIRVGGVSVDAAPEDKRRPIHRTLMDTDQVYTGDMFRSLLLSKVMAQAAKPNAVTKTMTGEGVAIDATHPFATIDLKPGEDYTQLPANQIDPSLLQAQQMIANEIDSASGVEMLRAMQNVSGMAFATFTAAMQVALTTVDPYKRMVELALADMFGMFVTWLKESGDGLKFYENARGENLGEFNEIPAEELPDEQDLYLTVQLKPYVPSDEMQRINAMQVMTGTLNFPKQRALEILDVEDADVAVNEWQQEQRDQAALQEELKDIAFEADLPRQMQLQQMQMQLQQQMAQQQQQAQMGMPQEAPLPPGVPGSNMPVNPMEGGPGAAFPGGPGFNPAMGGSSPVGAAPDVFANLSGPQLQFAEGRDNRGLRLPPEGREPRE